MEKKANNKKIIYSFITIIFGILPTFSFAKTYECSDALLKWNRGRCPECIETINEQKKYTACLRDKEKTEKYEEYVNKGITFIKSDNIESGIYYLESAKEYAESTDFPKLNNILSQAYFLLGAEYFKKEDYKTALYNYKKALEHEENEATIRYNIGICYINLKDYNNAYTYLKHLQGKDLGYDLRKSYNEVRSFVENKHNQATNDELNYLQYYLSGMNIYKAWESLPVKTNQVIIAVIDDGVNLNNDDLIDKLRVNTKEIPGNRIDDDKNGYVDDYNGWNFYTNSNNVLPTGEHGTVVAGIIASNSNNEIGIAGIVPNAKIMPLTVSNKEGTSNGYDILGAIEYAIDNGANIINISLGGSQFDYTDIYNSAFKKAHDKGIVVVVSAGNGDELSNKEKGVNTTVNKISPVCNEENKKTVIGVGSLDRNGNKSKRSNYGDCVDIYAYGEEIPFTTQSRSENEYTLREGTSFSAPIIAGVVGLGYNKYGSIKPNEVYDSLQKSLKGNIVDANKYLSILSADDGELKDAILWMYENGLTIRTDPTSFKYNRAIRRDEASKFLTQYAKNVMKKEIKEYKDGCVFRDLDDAWSDLRGEIFDSCQLGIFKGTYGRFRPSESLTNAQAITVFMRLYEGKRNENGDHYADQYYKDALSLGLLDGTSMSKKENYDKSVTRGDVALMLYRGWKLKYQ